MSFETISQLVRIVAYAVGGFFLGQGIADGQLFQAALSGLVSIAAFVWWLAVENRKTVL